MHLPDACYMQDAYLPQRLVDKLMIMYNYIEMARVTGVPMSFLLTRGQSIKVFCMILRKARQRKLLIPNVKVTLRCLVCTVPALHACVWNEPALHSTPCHLAPCSV